MQLPLDSDLLAEGGGMEGEGLGAEKRRACSTTSQDRRPVSPGSVDKQELRGNRRASVLPPLGA